MKSSNIFVEKFNFFEALRDAIRMHVRIIRQAPNAINCLIVDDDFFDNPHTPPMPAIESLHIIKLQDFKYHLTDILLRKGYVLICIEHAMDALPCVELLIANGIKYLTAGGHSTGGFVYEDRICRETIENGYIQQFGEGYDKFGDPGSAQDFVNLCQALLYTNRIEGDVIEVGCYRGSSGSIMLDYASNKRLESKKFWFFDVFSGFTYPEAIASSDANWANSHQTEGEFHVANRLSRKAGHNAVIVKKHNIISDDLPKELTKISLANIDVDLYEAVEAGLFRIAPLIQVGGIMICEDSGHTPALLGARVALEKFLRSEIGKLFTCIHMTSGQAFLVRHS